MAAQSDRKPVLWQIEVSHFSEKARWALDHKEIDHARRTGVVFHMMSALTELGMLGVTAVADSPAEADALFRRAEQVLLEEAAAPPESALPPV